MKTAKKFTSILLAFVLCFSVCVTALAASSDDFSITISNSVNGSTYNAYKIFDVTYDDNGNYSYTITSDSAWYELFTSTDSNIELDCPFTFTATTGEASGDVTVYNVTIAKNSEDVSYTDAEIIAYLEAAIAQVGGGTNGEWQIDEKYGCEGSVNGNGGTVTITLSEPGYYFVTTTTGSIVSITTTDPTATIIDKQTPPPDIEKVIVHGEGEDQTSDSFEADGMGEEVSFDVTATVPITETIEEEDGSVTYNYVTDYTITDSMTNGLLIELTNDQFTSSTDSNGVTHYYLSDTLINQWITMYTGSGQTANFTNSVYNMTFELVGYDVYTDETTGEDVHTFSGFVLTYYTYDVDQYKQDLKTALTEQFGDLSTIWPEDDEWPTLTAEQEAVFDFDSESYFEEYNETTNPNGTKYPANASIEIKYSAHVTSLEGYENTNEIYLDHHVTPFSHPTPWSPTPGPQKFARDYVYSWELQIVKVDGNDEVTPLEGATFTLYSANMQDVKVGHSYLYVPISLFEDGVYTDEDGNEYKLVDFESTHYVVDSNGSYVIGEGESDDYTYVRILTSDVVEEDTIQSYTATATTDGNGMIYFEGLGTGVYTLTEIAAPDGYNLLDKPIIFQITFNETEEGVGQFTVIYGSIDENGDFQPSTVNDPGTPLEDNYILVQTIENNSGTLLPGTGGMGTTIFYILGAILVLGAVVVLITRRRMNHAA